MKERKEMISFTQNISVPEIVDQKCREAYDEIYRECGRENKYTSFERTAGDVNEVVYSKCGRENRRKRFPFSKGLAIAACAAVVSAGAIVPAAAKYAPSLKSAFGFASKQYTKDPAEKYDISDFAETVDMRTESNSSEIVLQQVYCDGKNISAALALTPNDADVFKDTTAVYGNLKVSVDGKELRIVPEEWTDVIRFSRGVDGNYYAMLHYENQDITGEVPFEISINGIWGENGYMMKLKESSDGSCCYKPEKTISFSDSYEFTYAMKPDTSHNRIYEVNETQGNVTLEKLEVTPFMTMVYISGLDSEQIVMVTDQDERKLEGNLSYNDTENIQFTAPFTDSESLFVDVCRLDQDGIPVEYTFIVPIEEGFVLEYTAENGVFDKTKVIYDPPFEELEEKHAERLRSEFDKMKEKAVPVPAGESVSVKNGGDINDEYDFTITGYESIPIDDDVISEYDLDRDYGVNGIKMYKDACGDLEGAVLMLITCEIENTHGCSIEPCLTGPYLIFKGGYDSNNPYFSMSMNEYHYVSTKDNYGKDSYFYNFEPHEKKTITYGYVVSEDSEKTGYWACFYTNGGYGDMDYSAVTKGNAVLGEIK